MLSPELPSNRELQQTTISKVIITLMLNGLLLVMSLLRVNLVIVSLLFLLDPYMLSLDSKQRLSIHKIYQDETSSMLEYEIRCGKIFINITKRLQQHFHWMESIYLLLIASSSSL